MVCIVMFHSALFWGNEWVPLTPAIQFPVLGQFADWLGTFHVFAFTLVSGYIYYYVRFERNGYQKYGAFVLNKTKRLMVPNMVFTFLWAIPAAMFILGYDWDKIVKLFLLATGPNQFWYLWMLFCLFLGVYPISDFLRNNNIGGIIIVNAIYWFGTIGRHYFFNLFQLFSACQHLLFFWIGFKIRQNGSDKIMKIQWHNWLIIEIVLWSLSKYIPEEGILFKVVGLGVEWILHTIGALAAFVILQKIASKIAWGKNSVICYLNKRSLTVFMFHQQIIFAMVYLWNGKINPLLHAIIMFTVSMVISLILSSVMFNFRVTRALIGSR